MFPIYNKSGFHFFKEKQGSNSILGDSLIVDNKHNISELRSFLHQNKIRSLRIMTAHYPVKDLEFLYELPFIEGLIILGGDYDLTPLQSLVKLKVLSVDFKKSTLNFEKFPFLEVFSGKFSKRHLINLNKCSKLFWVWLDNYNGDDLTLLSDLTNLESLFLHNTSIKNLLGLGGMIKLKTLTIDSAKTLESMDGISPNNSKLIEIDIYNARKLIQYSSISLAKNLEKLRLAKTGDINNINFIDSLENLSSIIIGSKITQGDLSKLKRLNDVSILDYPDYNYKNSDFKR